jgi:hypothetical protein
MSLLLSIVVYLIVGCGEWYLALRRTLACARGEKVLLVSIVFIENLLGLWVLSNFVRTNNWFLALSYSAGASAGALIVAMRTQSQTAQTSTSGPKECTRTSMQRFHNPVTWPRQAETPSRSKIKPPAERSRVSIPA